MISRDFFDPAPYLEYLKEMAEHGMRARHGDGWGLWARGEYDIHHRETVPIWNSKIPQFPEVKILFAHARKKGEKGAKVAIENVHPFVHRGSVFMHNGFVDISNPHAPGETDSESFFINIVERELESAISTLSSLNVVAMNFVMYHQGKIWVMRYARKLEDYYTIYLSSSDGRIIISTEGDGKLLPNDHIAIIDPATLDVEYRPVFQDRSRQ